MKVNLWQLFEFATIYRFKKKIVSTETNRGNTVLTLCIADKFWKIEGNKLVNKDEDWKPKEEWNIGKGRGRMKKIENQNQTVLEIPEKNKEGNLAKGSYNKNKDEQMWKKGISDDNGYFTLKNKKSSQFLAADADSDSGFRVKGNMINFLCFNILKNSIVSFPTLHFYLSTQKLIGDQNNR